MFTARAGLAITSGGTVTGALAETSGAGALLSISGATGLNVSTIRSSGTATLASSLGAIQVASLRSTGAVAATARMIMIGGTGPLDFSTLSATAGDATVSVGTGTLIVRNAGATGTLSLTTGNGALTLQGGQAAAITVNSGSTATLNGTVTATNSLSVTSRGATTVNGIASGRTVRITSGDIGIGTEARVGTSGTTTLVELINGDGSSRTFVGGEATTQGYSLSASEMLRLFGNDITIRAPRAATQGGSALGSTRPADVVIGTFTLAGGGANTGNLGPNGTLQIVTPGAVLVNGAANLTGMTDANGFGISAGESIAVILGQGSIRLSGASSLGGTLSLNAPDVIVATSAAIADVTAAADLKTIDDRLAQNDGIVLDDGAIAAGGIRFSIVNGVYVQNSGRSDRVNDRRGFTAGTGGVDISTDTEAGDSRIVINGQLPDATGALQTGRDAIGLVLINGAAAGSSGDGSAFATGSTINGCDILNANTCLPDLTGIPPFQDNPLLTDSDEDDPATGEDTIAVTVVVDIRDVERFTSEPIVDEPVTGSGNDDLWSPPEPAAPECSAEAVQAGTCTPQGS